MSGFAWLSGLVLGVFAFNAVAYSCTAGGEAVLDYRGIYMFDAKTFVPKRGADTFVPKRGAKIVGVCRPIGSEFIVVVSCQRFVGYGSAG